MQFYRCSQEIIVKEADIQSVKAPVHHNNGAVNIDNVIQILRVQVDWFSEKKPAIDFIISGGRDTIRWIYHGDDEVRLRNNDYERISTNLY